MANGKRILCVGYEPSLLGLRCEVLLRAGYIVIAAGDRERAVACLKSNGVDLLIVGQTVPNSDILDFERLARRRVPPIPILVLHSAERPDGSANLYMRNLEGPEALVEAVQSLMDGVRSPGNRRKRSRKETPPPFAAD